jgi:hypothetical protein
MGALPKLNLVRGGNSANATIRTAIALALFASATTHDQQVAIYSLSDGVYSDARDVCADGSIVAVGVRGGDCSGSCALRWDMRGAPQIVSPLSGSGFAHGVSGDGSTAAGL